MSDPFDDDPPDDLPSLAHDEVVQLLADNPVPGRVAKARRSHPIPFPVIGKGATVGFDQRRNILGFGHRNL